MKPELLQDRLDDTQHLSALGVEKHSFTTGKFKMSVRCRNRPESDKKKIASAAGLEPTRRVSNSFRGYRLNRSAKRTRPHDQLVII